MKGASGNPNFEELANHGLMMADIILYFFLSLPCPSSNGSIIQEKTDIVKKLEGKGKVKDFSVSCVQL